MSALVLLLFDINWVFKAGGLSDEAATNNARKQGELLTNDTGQWQPRAAPSTLTGPASVHKPQSVSSG